MFDAIGKARVHLLSTEVEIGFARMAHWPPAYAIAEIQQARLVGNFGTRFGRHKPAWRRWRDRRLLIARSLAQKPAGADGNHTRLVGLRVWAGRNLGWRAPRFILRFGPSRLFNSSSSRLSRLYRRLGWRSLGHWERGLLGGRRFRAGRFVARLHRGGASLETQTVRLANHGIAADTAQLFGDLAGRCTAFPHLGQLFDSLFSPAHANSIHSRPQAKGSQAACHCGWQPIVAVP